ncbi:MAG TPA: cysteine hydrolase family protein [Anaerovoracaceae bacterium]|nr:cysteine hydrolase family protein [Anaerovoracaceae bacterium]
MEKALLIIDIQIMPFVWKDYGGKELYRSEALLKNVKGLIEKARAANAPVYYILHTEKGDSPRAEGQPLWQIHPEIAPNEQDQLIIKYHADSFHDTELNLMLKKSKTEQLVLCGVQTEFCVDTTCRSAYSHGYKVELAMDSHSTFDSDRLTAEQITNHHNGILSLFADVKPSCEILF